jgi:hypothetical protein
MNKTTWKSNYVSWNTNWVIFRRHFPLLLKPFIAGTIALLFWEYIIHQFNLSLPKEAENPVLFIGVFLLALIYALFAGYAISKVLDEYKEISKAVVKNDIDSFLLYRDEELPILVHLLIGTISFFIIFFTILFPYHCEMLGMLINFIVVFIFTLVYVIVRELDDYYRSIWFKEKIPKEWYEVNIAEHFKKEEKK